MTDRILGQALEELAAGDWHSIDASSPTAGDLASRKGTISTSIGSFDVYWAAEVADEYEVILGLRAHNRLEGPGWHLDFHWSSPFGGAPWEWARGHSEYNRVVSNPLYTLSIPRLLGGLETVKWSTKPTNVEIDGHRWSCGYEQDGVAEIANLLRTRNTLTILRYRRDL